MEECQKPKTQRTRHSEDLIEIAYSTELNNVKDATADLVANNAGYLIEYIYNNKTTSPYNNAEVRVGLVIKTLLKASGVFPSELMTQVVDDINDLVSDRDYLSQFNSPSERKSALQYELSFINKYIQLDDLISLNTAHHDTLKKK